MVEAVCSVVRNAGLQAVANPKTELVKVNKDGGHYLIRPVDVLLSSELCVGITVSASTSDTYKTHEVGKVINIRAQDKVKKNAATCTAYGLEFTLFVLNCCGVMHGACSRDLPMVTRVPSA